MGILQLFEEVGRFALEVGNAGHYFQSDGFIIGVAGFAAHIAKAPPVWPVAEQQAAFVAAADQVGKADAIQLAGACRGGPNPR